MRKNVHILLASISLIGVMTTNCSREEAAPKNASLNSQVSSNSAVQQWTYRADSYCFTSEAAINLTGLPAGLPCVMMYRKNYTEVKANKIINVFEGQINTADYPGVVFPYHWRGQFIDRDPRAYGYVWRVNFDIDQTGKASSSLHWNGVVDQTGLPPL